MYKINDIVNEDQDILLTEFNELLNLTENISEQISHMKVIGNSKKLYSLSMLALSYIFFIAPILLSKFLIKDSSFDYEVVYLSLSLFSLVIGFSTILVGYKIWKDFKKINREILKEERVLAKLINNLNNYFSLLYTKLSPIEATILEVRLERLHFSVLAK